MYELLDVRRDASAAEIRRAYELQINRAHRDGAIALAGEISKAYDTLSKPASRQLYDRHGMVAVRERSPGAAPPPTPWRIAKHAPDRRRSDLSPHRSWRMPVAAVFCLGIVAGLVLALWATHQRAELTGSPGPEQQVRCQPTASGAGYVYTVPAGVPPHCRNGATPARLSR
jgi:hypothetical protein